MYIIRLTTEHLYTTEHLSTILNGYDLPNPNPSRRNRDRGLPRDDPRDNPGYLMKCITQR